MGFEHKSVLLNETIEGLNIKPDGIYVDGTLSKKNLTPYQPLQTRMPVLLRISFREAQQTETLINKAEH